MSNNTGSQIILEVLRQVESNNEPSKPMLRSAINKCEYDINQCIDREIIELLARDGFTIIRSILEGRIAGGVDLALALSEALHNFPIQGDYYSLKLTVEKLSPLVDKHPVLSPLSGHLKALITFMDKNVKVV